MKTGIFIAEMESGGKFSVPGEIMDRLNLSQGDKVEILLKKIRSRRLEVTIHKNPMYKILELAEIREKYE